MSLKPIIFACTATLDLPPREIAERMLDLANWTDFRGYGPIPAIKSAEFEVRTPEIVGSRIRVINTDESTHVEEIVEWRPDQRLQLDMLDFAPPLSRMATRFEEIWEFERVGERTKVVRSIRMHPKVARARPALWLISFLLKGAIARHLKQMQ